MRPSVDQWALALAAVTAQRSTCLRRQVGCVLLDRHHRVIATGYNGVARGQVHCNEAEGARYPNACPGAFSPSGTNLDGCHAIHAEANALLQVHDPFDVQTCYCTASPCISCVKLLLNTGARRLVFLETYPHPEAQELWEADSDRLWVHYTARPVISLSFLTLK